jgi:pyruvate dehydrogenase E2 component (dihydrolipoamide acetyltransferase)
MAAEIKMPQLSDTMNAGKILSWKKNVGDKIARGDILAEVETEKANLEIESFHEGTLIKVLVPALSSAKVGEVIALIGKAGEEVIQNGSSPASNPVKAPPSITANQPVAAIAVTPTATNASQAKVPQAGDRIKASPLARRLAQERNIDIGQLRGSGPDGRIVRKDVETAQTAGSQQTPGYQATRPAAPTPSQQHAVREPARVGGGALTPLSKMRETIAKRMQESVTQAPHFYVTTSIAMDEAMRLRELLKERPDYKGISLNHLVIKAAAYALEREPRVNCAMRENQLYTPEQINIGIITAIEDGLLIPVVKEANKLTLKDLVFEARAAVERARAGRPSSTDLVGGTFSISNMGMFDVENFTAIINPGQGAVLAVSSVREEPVIHRGQIGIGLRMRATISVDHRIIDGVMAGNFQKFFKEALETPALLMA